MFKQLNKDKMSPKLEDLLPGIEEYLEAQGEKKIPKQDLNDFIFKVRSKTGFEKEICIKLVCDLFMEIRNSMLRGEIVRIKHLGNFFVANPKNTNNKERVFAKFVSTRGLTKRINESK